jgi:ABC-type phosphate transport system ATPase subunit
MFVRQGELIEAGTINLIIANPVRQQTENSVTERCG